MDQDKERQLGFRLIGDHLTKALTSLIPSGSPQVQPPLGSTTTGSQSLARKEPNAIGRRPGAIGAVVPRKTLSEALTGSQAAETDIALLASLPPLISRSLIASVSEVIDPKYGFDVCFAGYALRPGLPSELIAEALQLAALACAPAGPQQVIAELTRLRLLVKVRAEDEGNIAAMISILSEELEPYPPDVVRDVLRGWGRREKWWPSLAELRDLLDRAAKPRNSLAKALAGARP